MAIMSILSINVKGIHVGKYVRDEKIRMVTVSSGWTPVFPCALSMIPHVWRGARRDLESRFMLSKCGVGHPLPQARKVGTASSLERL